MYSISCFFSTYLPIRSSLNIHRWIFLLFCPMHVHFSTNTVSGNFHKNKCSNFYLAKGIANYLYVHFSVENITNAWHQASLNIWEVPSSKMLGWTSAHSICYSIVLNHLGSASIWRLKNSWYCQINYQSTEFVNWVHSFCPHELTYLWIRKWG